MQIALPWIVIAVADMDDYCVGAQMSALRAAALSPGQTDPFPRVMVDVASRVRTKIQSVESNVVSLTANSIPPECKWIACYLILDAMQTRIPTLRLSDSQKDQIKEAIRQLDRIADGKDNVSLPLDPVETTIQVGSAVEVVNNEIVVKDRINATVMSGLL